MNLYFSIRALLENKILVFQKAALFYFNFHSPFNNSMILESKKVTYSTMFSYFSFFFYK